MKLQFLHESNLNSVFREDRTDLPGLEDLNKSGISFVIVGALAVNVYSKRPRNTQDIDVLTPNYQEMADYIHKNFPDLEMVSNDVVIRFKSGGKEVIDVMIPYHKIFEIALQDTRDAGRFKVPSPEALIAMKFGAIMSQGRDVIQKAEDRVDIARVFLNNEVDFEKVAQYVSVLYSEAPEDFKAFMVKLREDYDQV